MSYFVRRAQVAAKLRAQQQPQPVEIPCWHELMKMDADELAALAGRTGVEVSGGVMSMRSTLNKARA